MTAVRAGSGGPRLAVGPHDGSLPSRDEMTRRSRFARLADIARNNGVLGLDAGNVLPAEPTVARSIFEERGLRLAAAWHGLRLLERSVEAELSRLEGCVNLVAGLGADVLVVSEITGSVHAAEVSWRRRPALHPHARRRLFRGLDIVAHHLSERGLRLAYHHHLGTVIEGARELDELLERTSNEVGLALDLGHAAAAGMSVTDLLSRHAERVTHVYARDLRPGVLEVANLKQGSFSEALEDGLFGAVGSGLSEVGGAFERLLKTGYLGWVVLGSRPGHPVRSEFTRVRRLLGRS